VNVEHIPGRTPRDSTVTEGLSDSRDVVVEGVVGSGRLTLAPDALDQAVAGDRFVRVQEEDREQRPLLRAPERQLMAVVPHLDGTENSELHHA
jgi:hypothetical protein